MDVFYEESAVNASASKNEVKYKFLHVLSIIFLVLWIICAVLAFFSIPVGENPKWDMVIFWLVNTVLFWIAWFFIGKIKRNINVSYDYTFVSGELRISKVFNVNKRKGFVKISCDEMLQIGDTDNPSYERLASSPRTKTLFCTSNETPAEGKFFMYILIGGEQKYLYILECRELMLMQILKFAKRSVLESDYVMQDKKQKKTI